MSAEITGGEFRVFCPEWSQTIAEAETVVGFNFQDSVDQWCRRMELEGGFRDGHPAGLLVTTVDEGGRDKDFYVFTAWKPEYFTTEAY